jgi:Cys-rich four helix bundle protein (predicted Tat secretion target)
MKDKTAEIQGQAEQASEGELSISRRALLAGTAAFAAGLSAAQAAAGSSEGHEGHAGHHHSGGGGNALIRAAGECRVAGEICDAHCESMLATGDTSLAACSAAVRDMMAACSALSRLAASNSKNLPAMAGVCRKILEDCKAECNKHPEHEECKACAEECDKCLAECNKITG